MKNFLLILLLTVFVSCATSTKKEPVKTPELSPVTIPSPVIISKVFTYKSSLKWVEKLSDSANCVLSKESFANRVGKVVSFDYSNDNGEQVYNKLINHNCAIRTYKTKWFSPTKNDVIATTYKSNKIDIYLNLRRNPREIPKMINTSIHECLHNVGYKHGANKNKNNANKNAAPNKVGKIAELESEGCY